MVVDLSLINGIGKPIASVDAQHPGTELSGRKIPGAVDHAARNLYPAFAAGHDCGQGAIIPELHILKLHIGLTNQP